MSFSEELRYATTTDLSRCPGDGRLQVLTQLARARRTSTGNLPLAVDMRSPGLAGVYLQYGWGRPGQLGRQTNRPVAQLLIIPEQPPVGKVEVKLYFCDGQSDPAQKIESFTLDINGHFQFCWQAPKSKERQYLLSVEVPLSATRQLPAYFITLKDFKRSGGAIDGDIRQPLPGISVSTIMFRPIE